MSGWTLAVDYGTTSTVTAMANAAGDVEVLEVDGYRKIPSMIVVDDDGTIVVGAAAAGLARSMPQRAIRTPKNRLGDQVPVVIGGTPYQPVNFVAAVLEHIYEDAVRFHGSAPIRSRLTYPATWNRPKRTRLLEAAAKAGFPDPELVAEPIAAALTHAHVEALAVGDHVAVYDLGGGTFDTVVLLRTTTGFSVVGDAMGDPQLGGELFDEILMNHVGEQIEPELWEQLLVSDDPDWTRAAVRLRDECKRAKEALSMHPHAEVSVGLPGGSVAVGVSRTELSELIMPYIDESIELLGRCMSKAGKDGDSIQAIYVTGGASRMPLVEERVRAFYPTTQVSRRGDPKVAVALGALRADPGSLDNSVQRQASRTTDDAGLDRPSPPIVAPKAPSVDVPQGPETRFPEHTGSTVPDVPIASAVPAVELAPVGEGTAIQQDPLHHVVHTDDEPNASEADGISMRVIGASLLAVLALAALAGFFLLPGSDSENPAGVETTDQSSTSTTSEVAEGASSSTSASSSSTTETTTQPEEAAVEPTAISAISDAQFAFTELGVGWYELDQVDQVNLNLCELAEPAAPVDESLGTFVNDSPTAQLTSRVQRFASVEKADAMVDFTQSLSVQCSSPVQPWLDGEFLTGSVVALRADDAATEVVFPDGPERVATLAYRFVNPDFPSVEPHMLVTQVRVGDKVGSLVFYSPGKPSVAHINFLTELVAIQVQRLEGAG